MNSRLRILLVILVVGFAIMGIVSNETLDWGSTIVYVVFGAAMVGIVYFHAQNKKEPPGAGTRILHTVIASVACSVGLAIVLQVVLIVFGIDLFDMVSEKLIPLVIISIAVLLLPFFWRFLEQ